jgi:hypothetical protein
MIHSEVYPEERFVPDISLDMKHAECVLAALNTLVCSLECLLSHVTHEMVINGSLHGRNLTRHQKILHLQIEANVMTHYCCIFNDASSSSD